MSNLLNDPDVLKLYRDLQSKKYSGVDDYLSSPLEDSDTCESSLEVYTPKRNFPEPPRKMFWGGEEVKDFEMDEGDYGM